MKGQPSIRMRTRGLRAEQHDRQLQRLATHLAADLGITPQELLADAAQIARRCQSGGALTWPTIVAEVAAQTGLDPEVLRADVEHLAEVAG